MSFYNTVHVGSSKSAMHAPNASYMSVQLAILCICGLHAKFVETMASFVMLIQAYTEVLEYASLLCCHCGSVYGVTAPLLPCGGYVRRVSWIRG